jgi:site-specific DNA-cytosine methylase
MEGMSKGSGTRSGLLWEVERLLEECGADLPQILVMENVPQVHGTKNREDFDRWCEFLNGKGYTNAWQDLNAKNYGVAQSRNRCFMVSWLGNYTYEFPKPIPLKKRMKDYLEDSVDDKYYIRNEKAKKLIQKLIDTGTIPGNALDRQTDRQTVDLYLPEPTRIEIASAIVSRYDNGISMHKQARSGVVELWSCGVDLTSGETSLVEIANSICARHDAGIVNHKNEHTGVIEWKITGAKS